MFAPPQPKSPADSPKPKKPAYEASAKHVTRDEPNNIYFSQGSHAIDMMGLDKILDVALTLQNNEDRSLRTAMNVKLVGYFSDDESVEVGARRVETVRETFEKMIPGPDNGADEVRGQSWEEQPYAPQARRVEMFPFGFGPQSATPTDTERSTDSGGNDQEQQQKPPLLQNEWPCTKPELESIETAAALAWDKVNTTTKRLHDVAAGDDPEAQAVFEQLYGPIGAPAPLTEGKGRSRKVNMDTTGLQLVIYNLVGIRGFFKKIVERDDAVTKMIGCPDRTATDGCSRADAFVPSHGLTMNFCRKRVERPEAFNANYTPPPVSRTLEYQVLHEPFHLAPYWTHMKQGMTDYQYYNNQALLGLSQRDDRHPSALANAFRNNDSYTTLIRVLSGEEQTILDATTGRERAHTLNDPTTDDAALNEARLLQINNAFGVADNWATLAYRNLISLSKITQKLHAEQLHWPKANKEIRHEIFGGKVRERLELSLGSDVPTTTDARTLAGVAQRYYGLVAALRDAYRFRLRSDSGRSISFTGLPFGPADARVLKPVADVRADFFRRKPHDQARDVIAAMIDVAPDIHDELAEIMMPLLDVLLSFNPEKRTPLKPGTPSGREDLPRTLDQARKAWDEYYRSEIVSA